MSNDISKLLLEQFKKIGVNQDLEADLVDFLEKTDRFTDVRNFLERAIEVFLAWEQDPQKSTIVMAKWNPTMEQYQILSMMMKPEQLANMWKGKDWPKKWGNEWIEFQKSHPMEVPDTDEAQKRMNKRKSEKDFEEIQKNMEDSRDFVREIKSFKDIVDDNYVQTEFDGWPIISPMYSRFLPAKIAVVVLANMMKNKKSPLINVVDF